MWGFWDLDSYNDVTIWKYFPEDYDGFFRCFKKKVHYTWGMQSIVAWRPDEWLVNVLEMQFRFIFL